MESPDAYYRALADPVRRRILRLLEDSGAPCDVETLAGWVSLHPNTVRGHLDLLEQAGLVTKGTRRRDGPGRPRLEYQLVAGRNDGGAEGYRLLAELLANTITSSAEDPPGAARAAGRSWGRQRLEDLSGRHLTREVAEEYLTALLHEMGFEPHASRRGDRTVIELNGCPFRELARQHGDVVCSLHLGLMQGAAEALGNTEVENLQPFVEPSVCRTVVVSRRAEPPL